MATFGVVVVGDTMMVGVPFATGEPITAVGAIPSAGPMTVGGLMFTVGVS